MYQLEKPHRYDLHVLAHGQVHQITGVMLVHSELVDYLNKHTPNWELASYHVTVGNTLLGGSTTNHNQLRRG